MRVAFINPPHPLFFHGEEFGAEAPAMVNVELYAMEGWKWLRRTDGGIEIYVRDPVPYRGRTMLPVLLRGADGEPWHQPFYRSTGRATPGLSPEGTLWPCSGPYTRAYAIHRKSNPFAAGFIGKAFYRPSTRSWVDHAKRRESIPELLHQVAAALHHNTGAPAALRLATPGLTHA